MNAVAKLPDEGGDEERGGVGGANALALSADDAALLNELKRLGAGRDLVPYRNGQARQLVRMREDGLIELGGEAIGKRLVRLTPRGLMALAAHPGLLSL